MDKRNLYQFNIFYLVIAILWPLVKSLYLGGIDGAGRVEMLLMTIALLANFKGIEKSPRQMLLWGVWIMFVVICSHYKGFQNEYQTFWNWTFTNLAFPFVSMLVAYQAIIFDYNKTIKILFWSYLFYVILGSLSMSSFESYDSGSRMANVMGNEYFNTSILFAAFVGLFFSQGNLKKLYYWILLLLVFYVIYRSGERKGLICVFIIIFGSFYAANSGKGIKSIIYMTFLLLIGMIAVDLILTHSTAGQRMASSMTESQFQDNLFLRMMGDRGIMYYLGWDMFLRNPWTGIGITNFCWENGYMHGLPFHTEYMVQLAECGIIGTLFFVILYFGMIKKLFACFKKKIALNETIILISTLVSILVINLVSWTYDNPNYFMMYGIIYGFYQLKCGKVRR